MRDRLAHGIVRIIAHSIIICLDFGGWEVCSGIKLLCPLSGGLRISGTGVLSSLPRPALSVWPKLLQIFSET